MSKTIVKIPETFILRSIDPIDILSKYLKGEYKTLKIPTKKVKNKFLTTGKNIGTNPSYEIYRLLDKSNTHQTIFTTNHNLYNHYSNVIKHKKSDRPLLKCTYCRRDIKGEYVGLPVSMEMDKEHVSFFTEGYYCHFGCAYANLKRVIPVSRIHRDPLYMDAEQLLHCMYHKLYPNEPRNIVEAPDWRLCRSNGGPLTDEEFDSKTYKYVAINNVAMLPVKRQYMKLAN